MWDNHGGVLCGGLNNVNGGHKYGVFSGKKASLYITQLEKSVKNHDGESYGGTSGNPPQ